MKDYSLRNEKSRLIQATATSLHEHITELFENGYDQGYEDGKKEKCDCKDNMEVEYNRGLNEAWEAAKKITEIPINERGLVFDLRQETDLSLLNLLKVLSIQKAITKIKEYEDKQKLFRIGDEVYSDAFDDKGIITHITADKVSCVCIICNGYTMMKVGINGLHKTGRHFDAISEILAEMRGDKE